MSDGETDPLQRSWRHVEVTHEGGLVEVHLKRLEARNALDLAFLRELTEVARLLRLRTDVNAVIVTGTREYFSAGADLSAIKQRVIAPTVLESREMIMAGPISAARGRRSRRSPSRRWRAIVSAAPPRWPLRAISASWGRAPICGCRKCPSAST